MKQIILRVLCILTTFYSLAYAEPIKIGIITDLTGHGAYWGTQTRLGAQILEKELHAAGVNVQFIYADSKFIPSQGVTEAHKLINLDKVDALFVEFGSIVNAVSPVAHKFGKLLLAAAGATSFLESNPNSFKIFLNYEIGCKKVSEYWKRNGVQSLGILKVATETAELCSKGAKEIYPDIKEKVSAAGDDTSTHLLSFKAQKISAILSTGYENDSLNTLKNLKTFSYGSQVGGPDSDILTTKVIATYPSLLENITTFAYAPVGEEFEKIILKEDPKNNLSSPEAVANAYIFLNQVVKSISECAKDDIVCQTKVMASQGPEKLLNFKGWKNRMANHEFVLNKWVDGKREVIEKFSLND